MSAIDNQDHPAKRRRDGTAKTAAFALRPTTFIILCAIATANARSGGGYTIIKSSIDSGGGTATGGAYVLTGTAGQHDAGEIAGGSYALSGGFWSPLAKASCLASTPALAETMPDDTMTLVASIKNRYLSIRAGDPGRMQAVQVAFASLPSPYSAWDGTRMWVQEPEEICNKGAVREANDPNCGGGTFWGATLGCTPYHTDWSVYDMVHVYNEGIIPSTYTLPSGPLIPARYDIRVTDQSCAIAPGNFSAALVIENSRYGNVAGPFVNGLGRDSYTAPDAGHAVDISPDFLSVVEAFRGTPIAPIKPRVDMEFPLADQVINFTDAVLVIDAFRGLSYPYTPSGGPPCP